MANGGRIDFTVGFKTDQAGLTDIKKQLNELSKLSYSTIQNMNPGMTMNQAATAAQKLRVAIDEIGPALDAAFNTDTGIMNIEKLRSSLKRLDLVEIQKRFHAIGPQGQAAFANISKAALTANVQLKQTSNLLDKMGTTLVNTLKWSVSSSLINNFTGAFQQAYGYVQHLDTSLNDIRIVTGKSADEMTRFGEQANKAAKDLGKATTDYTEAALIYYQQGLADDEVRARTETTLKAANVTGQSTSEVSEQLTAVWNGYRVSAENTEVAVDKLAAVAATTAADLEELSTGMSKVAAAANSMGVDMDQLNATIATIESVTRQAPESVGTALKTIYARMGDLKLGETDEDGLGLGDVSGTLEKVGIEVLDVNGDLRDMGTVIEEIGAKWDTWTKAEKTAIAEAVAGKRQYNNLFALFDSWDMYTQALETSRNSMGTLQKQQDIYMQSTAAHVQELKTEWEDLYDSVLDTKDVNNMVDGLTIILDLITNIIDGLGGGKTLLLGIISLVSTRFSKQIAEAFSPMLMNQRNEAYNQSILNTLQQNIDLQLREKVISGEAAEAMTQKNAQMMQYWHLMTEEEFNASQSIIREIGNIATETEKLKERRAEFEKWMGLINKGAIVQNGDYLNTGTVNQQKALDQIEKEKEEVNRLTVAYEELHEIINDFSLGASSKAEEQRIEELDEIQSRLQEIQDLLHGFNNQELFSEEQFEQTEKNLDKVTKKLDELRAKADNPKAYAGFGAAKANFDALGNDVAHVSKKMDEFSDTVQNNSIQMEHNAAKTQEATNSLNIDRLSVELATESFSKLLGATTSLAFGLQSLSNIGNIFTDENLSGWQKFLQITTTLGFGLGSLMTGFRNLGAGITAARVALLALLPTETSQAIVEGTINNLTKDQIIALGKEIGLHIDNVAAISAENKVLIVNQALKKNNKTAIEQLNKGNLTYIKSLGGLKTKIADAGGGLKGLLKIIKDGAVKGFNDLASAIGVSTKSLGIFAAAAAAAIITFKLVQKHYKDLRKYNNLQIDKANETQEEVKTNKELIDSYLELYKEYKKTGNASDELKKAAEEVIKTLDMQSAAVKILSENYDGLTDSIKTAKETELVKGQQSADREVRAAGENLKNKATEGWLNSKELGGDSFQINIPVGYSYEEGSAEKTVKEALQGIANFTDSSGQKLDPMLALNPVAMSTITASTDPESILKLYDALNKAAKKLEESGETNTETYKGISKWIAQVSDDVEVYRQAVEDLETYSVELAGLSIDEDSITGTDSYKEARDKLIEDIKKATGIKDDDRASALADQWLADNLTGEAAQYGLQFNAAADLFKNYEDKIDGLTQEKVQDFINKMVDENTFQYESYFDEEDWKKILGAKDFDKAQSYIQEAIGKHTAQIRESLQPLASTYSDTIDTLLNKVNSGELNFSNIEGSEEFQSISDNLDMLLTQFPELSDAANVFLTDGMVGSEEWTEAVYRLKDAYDQLKFEDLNRKVDEAYENLKEIDITVDAKTDDFVNAIEDLLDAEYAVNVQLYADGIEEFEGIEKALDDIDEMASKVGEDFIVAADDIRELNNTFPGILEGMTYLADGTVQLNEDIARAAMDAANAEEISSTDATATKLENTAVELRAKADMYDTMSKIAADAAKGTVDLEEAKDKIIQQLDQVQTDNNKEVTDTEIQNAHAVVDDSAENAPILAQNWSQSYQEATKAANDWAEVATAANAAVANGDTTWTRKGEYGVNFKKGRTAQTNQQVKSADIQEYSKEQMQDLSNTFKNIASAYRQQANDAEGAAAELRAKGLSSVNKNNNIGLNTDTSKDSSSSSSEKEAEHEEYLERETDLYRKVNAELDNIEKTLNRIQKVESHEWGIDYQKSLEEENELLDKQLQKLQEKKKLQEQDLSVRRKQLEDVGVAFSADGTAMQNAEAVLNGLYANYNSMVNKYNSMSAAQQEGYKATLEAEKDRIDKIGNKMSEYESTFSEYQSTLDSLLEVHYQQIENEVKKFNNMVEVHLELSEAKREWEDFWYDVVQDMQDDDYMKQIEKSIAKLGSLIGTTLDNADSDVAVLTKHLAETVNEVEAQILSANRGGEDSLFGDDTAAAKENLEDYRDKLIQALTDAKEEIDNISETYIKMLEHAQDLIDDQVEGWEGINDHLEHNVELIKLITGDKAFDALDKQYEQQYKNNLSLINTQKQSQDFWAGEIQRYKDLLSITEENTIQWKTYSEALEKASENYRKAVQDLDKTVEKALKDLETWRKNQTDAILDAVDKAISGGLGLDLLEQEWKLINDEAGKYLDNVQRAYSMEEYANELDQAANAIGLSAQNQAKLNAFREEELQKLREKDKLTKYDIEESRARLAILQQQLALEDAQRNKSNLRLRRDSQGNYTYQYTADQGAVEDAQGGLLTAKKEWYELVKARRKETNDWIIEAEKNLTSILTQIDEAQRAGDTERVEKLKELEQLARQDVVNAYAEAGKNIQDIYSGTAQFFADVNNASILPENQATVSQLVMQWTGSGEESFIGAVNKGIEDLDKVQIEWSNRTKTILQEAGVNYTDLKENGIDPTTESLEEMVQTNEELAYELENVNTQLTEQEGNLRQVESAYYSLQSAAVSAISSANAALNALAQTAINTAMQVRAAIAAANSAPAIVGNYNYNNGNKNSGNTFSNYQGSDANKKNTAKVYAVGNSTNTNSGTSSYYIVKNGKQVGQYQGPAKDVDAAVSAINDDEELKKKYKLQGVEVISGYATGGYTGAWPGSDGKLAVLHQKELVLNETDTQNILGAVNAIRALDFSGVAKALIQSSAVQGSVLSRLGSGVLNNVIPNQSENISNTKNIIVNADFSGVRSADAIYEALISLENVGMQTAYSSAPHAGLAY